MGLASESTDPGFTVWGVDRTPYGPVELPTLVSWVQDERVTPDTWVFTGKDEAWRKASSVPELQVLFRRRANGASAAAGPLDFAAGLSPGQLRRIKILSNMSDEQLARFAGFMQCEQVAQFGIVVKQGDRGDAMYLILDGELRVRIDIAGKETTLATLGIGEFFGDISLFDQGPRSADVVANKQSTLMKITADSFERLAKEAPELATPLLLAIGRTLTARIRSDNKRYGDSVKFARAAQ